jgi:hypothetical protein
MLDAASRAQKTEDGKERFLPANHRFRVIAIGKLSLYYPSFILAPFFASPTSLSARLSRFHQTSIFTSPRSYLLTILSI